jgi:ATP-dependent Clp protease ATP-binding subunit ClpA
VIGRDTEIERVLRILSRQRKNNCCLVGPPGVGKSAVAEGVAARIAAGNVPPALTSLKELWSLNVGALLAGTQYRGTFEEQLTDLLDEVVARKGQMVLFVDEIHMLVGAGKSENNNIDAANLLKPALARGVACLGATTAEEYDILKKDGAFERRFQVVKLNEPSVPEAIEMLRGVAPVIEQHHQVYVAPGAIEAAVKLTHSKIRHRRLPDKAIDVLDEACALAVVVEPSNSSSFSDAAEADLAAKERTGVDDKRNLIERPKVTEKDVAAVVRTWHSETHSFPARFFSSVKEALRSRL